MSENATEWPSALSRGSWMGMPTTDDDKTKKREATEKNEEDNGKKPKVDDGEEEKPAKEEEKPMFLKGLVDKDGSPVDEASLQGKVVALYFSSSWCGACVTFTPILSVLFEEDEDDNFAVVFVSSDDTAEQCQEYFQKKHADWFLIPFEDEDQRQSLKKKYGVFAGKERGLFPDTDRKSGIPTLVVVDRQENCLQLLDCDDPKVHKEITSKGVDFLKQWENYKWE